MWILREIETNGGEVDFHDFMELALYHSEHGYYTSKRDPWGPDGDYLTAPTVSNWYGTTWAGFLGQLSHRIDTKFSLVDLAAGDGSFVAGVLNGLSEEAPRVLNTVEMADRSAVMRARAGRRLSAAAVDFEIVEVAKMRGLSPLVIHASELYDAMPVHRVEQTAEGLMEMVVAVEGGRLVWRRRPAPAELARYFVGHGVRLAEGQVAEVNPAAESFHRRTLERAGEGIIAVLDYGYEANRLYDSRGRGHGSLVSYRRHRVGRDLLESPGEQDLTAHVNWDDLRRAAVSCGWREIALVPLAEFLVRAGLEARVQEAGFGVEANLDVATVTARQELKQLLDPEGMGSDLKVLIQGKGDLGEAADAILNRGP